MRMIRVDVFGCQCSQCGKVLQEVHLREDATLRWLQLALRVYVLGWLKLVVHWCEEGTRLLMEGA